MRPKNIVKIKTNLLAELKSAVIPLLSPTVLYAETHSKVIFNKFLSESKNEIQRIAIEMANIERTMSAKAFLMVELDISRLYISSLDLPLIILVMLRKAIAKELVFIPPPVEAGEAPIHIRKIVTIIVEIFSCAVSTVLNPAVLVVTEPKNAVTILPIELCCDNVLSYSDK